MPPRRIVTSNKSIHLSARLLWRLLKNIIFFVKFFWKVSLMKPRGKKQSIIITIKLLRLELAQICFYIMSSVWKYFSVMISLAVFLLCWWIWEYLASSYNVNVNRGFIEAHKRKASNALKSCNTIMLNAKTILSVGWGPVPTNLYKLATVQYQCNLRFYGIMRVCFRYFRVFWLFVCICCWLYRPLCGLMQINK